MYKIEEIAQIFSDNENRDDFLFEYNFDIIDQRINQFLKQWIRENVNSNENIVLEHCFKLSVEINYIFNDLIRSVERVLKGRYFYLTKLSALDLIFHYCLTDKGHQGLYRSINKLGISKTRNRLVKFQALINECVLIDNENALSIINNKILRILKQEIAPFYWYRFCNFVGLSDVLKSRLKPFISEYVSLLSTKGFSPEVNAELSKCISFHFD